VARTGLPGRLAALNITPRLYEVLRMVAAGMTDREIAQRLYLAEDTIKTTHVRRLLSRLDARNRAHAVAQAYRAGILLDPGRVVAYAVGEISMELLQRDGRIEVTG
jgi:DNA-binding NarL/FixJ family response regulator